MQRQFAANLGFVHRDVSYNPDVSLSVNSLLETLETKLVMNQNRLCSLGVVLDLNKKLKLFFLLKS